VKKIPVLIIGAIVAAWAILRRKKKSPEPEMEIEPQDNPPA